MKTRKIILVGMLAVGLVSLCFKTDIKLPAMLSMNLQDAEKDLVVKSEITSKGNYSGDCMNLSLTNLKSTTTSITIPAGTVFIAENDSEQNILVTKDIICQLKGKEIKNVDISGYCCEKSDAAPNKGSTFKTSKHTDEKVLKLADFIKGKNYDSHTIQEAVWCVANGAPVSNIYCENPTDQKELMKFVCDLTGQKESWYTRKQNHEINEQRQIVSSPVEINGMLKCDIEKPVRVSNSIYSIDGKLIYEMENPMHFPRKGHYEYEFKLTVRGWEKGKYYVLVKAGEKQLLKQEFEI